jgi:co-chaperonin GroES (HSP10)
MLTPKGNRIHVVPYEKPDVNPGGVIVIPDAYRDDPTKTLWEVVAVGDGYTTCKGVHLPVDGISIDDIVLAERFSATLIEDPTLAGLDTQLLNVYTIDVDRVVGIVGRVEREE